MIIPIPNVGETIGAATVISLTLAGDLLATWLTARLSPALRRLGGKTTRRKDERDEP